MQPMGEYHCIEIIRLSVAAKGGTSKCTLFKTFARVYLPVYETTLPYSVNGFILCELG